MEETAFEIGNKILIVNLLRYFTVAGIPFLIYYTWRGQLWQYKKIQERFPKLTDYQREIGYSLITSLIFAIVGMIVFASPVEQYILRYSHISDYGWGYWFISIVLMILLHDTYFYWTHRAMHHPRLFKYFHLVHHKSTNPSPWASYAFHPLEGFVEAAVIFPIAFLIPFHPTALIVFLLFMMVYNVYGHLGYEIFPKRFYKHPIGKWLNTSTAHNQHHRHFKGNYGLYFMFWDKWMGTLRTDYEAMYAKIDKKRLRELKDVEINTKHAQS